MVLLDGTKEKILDLLQKHDNQWQIAGKFFKLEQFDCYNPYNYHVLYSLWFNSPIKERDYLGKILDLERQQYFLYNHVSNMLGGGIDFDFINCWDITEELIMLASPFEEKRYLLLDWIDGYTTEEENSPNFVPKDEIIDMILDDSEEQRQGLIDFKKEQDAMR